MAAAATVWLTHPERSEGPGPKTIRHPAIRHGANARIDEERTIVTPAEIVIRYADLRDAKPIAELHADSWRRHYRGAYSSRYLDGDLVGERLSVWTERLDHVSDEQFTLVAESADHVIGFAHVIVDADPVWGALIENLHVTKSLHRNGVGTRLLGSAAAAVVERRPTSPIYLWVQEQNTKAQAFYLARHGRLGDREQITPPGGDPGNLDGTPFKIRVSWRETAMLLAEPND